MPQYAVYADLSRPLTGEERSAVFEAVEASVPGSGCVGRQSGPNDEVYFCVEAPGEDDARAQADAYMSTVLERARLGVEYMLSLQTTYAT
jgi:hypothetical protein